MDEPEIKGTFEGYNCANCQRRLDAFVSHGIRGQEAEPFTTIRISPCQYCKQTDKLRGARIMLGHLIDEREL